MLSIRFNPFQCAETTLINELRFHFGLIAIAHPKKVDIHLSPWFAYAKCHY
jgi:hypothetical protein